MSPAALWAQGIDDSNVTPHKQKHHPVDGVTLFGGDDGNRTRTISLED